jgi:hypothetical protein
MRRGRRAGENTKASRRTWRAGEQTSGRRRVDGYSVPQCRWASRCGRRASTWAWARSRIIRGATARRRGDKGQAGRCTAMLPHVQKAQKQKRSCRDERSRRFLGRETMRRSARLHASPRHTVFMPMLISLKDCLLVSGVLLCLVFATSWLLLAEEDSSRRGDIVATIAGLDLNRVPHVSGDSDGGVLSRLLQHTFVSASLPLLPVGVCLCRLALFMVMCVRTWCGTARSCRRLWDQRLE